MIAEELSLPVQLEHDGSAHSGSGGSQSSTPADLLHTEPPNPDLLPPPLICLGSSASSQPSPSSQGVANGRTVLQRRVAPKRPEVGPSRLPRQRLASPDMLRSSETPAAGHPSQFNGRSDSACNFSACFGGDSYHSITETSVGGNFCFSRHFANLASFGENNRERPVIIEKSVIIVSGVNFFYKKK